MTAPRQLIYIEVPTREQAEPVAGGRGRPLRSCRDPRCDRARDVDPRGRRRSRPV